MAARGRWQRLPPARRSPQPPDASMPDASLSERMPQADRTGLACGQACRCSHVGEAQAAPGPPIVSSGTQQMQPQHPTSPPRDLSRCIRLPPPAHHPADLCTSPLVASSIMMTTSAVRATAITCRPRPFPGQGEEMGSHGDRGTPPSPQGPRLLSLTAPSWSLPRGSPGLGSPRRSSLIHVLFYSWRLAERRQSDIATLGEVTFSPCPSCVAGLMNISSPNPQNDPIQAASSHPLHR